MIAEQTGADLFEVLPVDEHYPMTYAELTDVAKQEQNDKARPEYAGELPELSQYDTVFIGAPVGDSNKKYIDIVSAIWYNADTDTMSITRISSIP